MFYANSWDTIITYGGMERRTSIGARGVGGKYQAGIVAAMTDIRLDPDRLTIQIRSPENDKPEATITYDGKCLVKRMRFEELRLLVKQGQECLMRYPVQPKPPSAA